MIAAAAGPRMNRVSESKSEAHLEVLISYFVVFVKFSWFLRAGPLAAVG